MPTYRRFWKWLLAHPEEPVRPIDIVMWWEVRRIPYNLIVGAFGVLSLALLYLFITACHELQPGEDAVEPLAVVLAAFVANLCYTAGWVSELLLFAMRKRSTKTGLALFVVGTVFSLVVVAVPSVLWGISWLARIVSRGL